jgi:hypothetical protein
MAGMPYVCCVELHTEHAFNYIIISIQPACVCVCRMYAAVENESM